MRPESSSLTASTTKRTFALHSLSASSLPLFFLFFLFFPFALRSLSASSLLLSFFLFRFFFPLPCADSSLALFCFVFLCFCVFLGGYRV